MRTLPTPKQCSYQLILWICLGLGIAAGPVPGLTQGLDQDSSGPQSEVESIQEPPPGEPPAREPTVEEPPVQEPEPPPESIAVQEEPQAPNAEPVETPIQRLREEIDQQIQDEIDGVLEEAEREVKRARREGRRRGRISSNARVSVGGDVEVEEDEVVREAVTVGGDIDVEGEVLNNVVSIGGSITIDGKVNGSVTAVGGSVYVSETAEILGNVTSAGGEVDLEPGATVLGEINEVAYVPGLPFDYFGSDWPDLGVSHRTPWHVFRIANVFDLIWMILCLGVLFLVVSLIFLAARTSVERADRTLMATPWKAGLVGLVILVLLVPILALLFTILAITCIGCLLIPFVILALLIVWLVGYTATCQAMGRWISVRFEWQDQSPYATLLIGFVAIHLWLLLGQMFNIFGGPLIFFAAMFSAFGSIVIFAAGLVGLGAVFLARFGSSGSPAPMAPPAIPPSSEPASEVVASGGEPPPLEEGEPEAKDGEDDAEAEEGSDDDAEAEPKKGKRPRGKKK